MIVPEQFQTRMHKARALATELRCLLEELRDDFRDGDYVDWEQEIDNEILIECENIEGTLDGYDMGDK